MTLSTLSCIPRKRGGSKPRIPLANRFWAKVNIPSDQNACWGWIAMRDLDGYGMIWPGGAKGPMLKASRVSWEIHFGPIPSGLSVLHTCDNPSCVNPSHLFLGTQKDNRQDATRKGRTAKGEENGSAKLTEPQVRDIRARYVEGGITMRTLAKMFGVHPGTIGDILHRQIWRHIF